MGVGTGSWVQWHGSSCAERGRATDGHADLLCGWLYRAERRDTVRRCPLQREILTSSSERLQVVECRYSNTMPGGGWGRVLGTVMAFMTDRVRLIPCY